MEPSFEELARHAAQKLAPEIDQNLPALVEARLQAGEKLPQRFDVGTSIALAALLVSISQLAWDIYREFKKDAKQLPSSDIIARQIRLELPLDEKITHTQRDKAISIIATEIIEINRKGSV